MIRALCAVGVLALVACGSPKNAEPTAAVVGAAPSAIPPRKDDAQRASKNGVVVGTVGGIPVEVHYGRPNVAGRTVFGELVPYGAVWRTGANEATTLTLGQDAKVGGTPIEAGTYSLFTIPGEQEWTVILNRTAAQWGAFKYDAAADVLRVSATPVVGEPTETFTIAIEGDELWLKWAELRVPIAISAP